MVLSVDVDVNDLARLGRYFPWPKPSCCPCCQQDLWWHGFALAYFSILVEAVFIRRLYCPHCKSTHRLRPSGYWPRFRSSIKEIRETIAQRTETKRWRPDLPRPRQRLWWRRLGKICRAILGLSFSGNHLDAFDAMVNQGIIPVTCATESDNRMIK